jgi:hypothetical protein
MDLLAAGHFIDRFGREEDCYPVAMLGAAHRIPGYALPSFAGKQQGYLFDAGKARAGRSEK